MTARRAAILAGGALLVVYISTLAPSVTFWDSGEFIAAARVLGIPHPPGTPLFVVVLNVWARLWWFLPFATATNLFSAVCTAAAAALTGNFVARALEPFPHAGWAGLAAAVTCGAMSSVWLNATETEVYAAALLLAVCMLCSADRSARSGERRWLLLAAYLTALAVPLHASALVALPAAVVLAAHRRDGRIDWNAALLLTGAGVIAIGATRASSLVSATGVLLLAASTRPLESFSRATILESFSRAKRDENLLLRPAQAVAALGLTLVALSALAFLFVRARHDPAINQGNPSTWSQLVAVVARDQYDVAGLWPRRAPLWLQISNWFEYADWQIALSLAPSVVPSVARVLATLVFAAVGMVGARWHRALDRRTWRAAVVLCASGSIAVVAYLNLKAGASFAWSFVPSGAGHEARDRDYFFVLGFWTWGLWAGMGCVYLATRVRLPALIGVFAAALPIALNWSAVTRRPEPGASLPGRFAHWLLDDLPPRAMLFVAGDNDTYPLWYVQQVEHRRPDVIVVTVPLLEADWYAREVERRSGGSIGALPSGSKARARGLAVAARESGRPVFVSPTVSKVQRNLLNDNWRLAGLVLESVDHLSDENNRQTGPVARIQVDTSKTRRTSDAVTSWLDGRVARPSADPVDEYVLSILECPRLALLRSPLKVQLVSLDSTCNLR